MASRSACPTKCLETNPTSKSIRLGGRFINLAQLSEKTGFDHGYLSRIFAGNRTPSVSYAQTIAKHLGVLTDEGDPDTTRLFQLIQDHCHEVDDTTRRRLA